MRTAQANATFPDELTPQKPRLVWHWYDLICPFCYVGQDRSAVLERCPHDQHARAILSVPPR